MSKVFTLAEVSQHSTNKDCWLLIDGKVFELSLFISKSLNLFRFCYVGRVDLWIWVSGSLEGLVVIRYWTGSVVDCDQFEFGFCFLLFEHDWGNWMEFLPESMLFMCRIIVVGVFWSDLGCSWILSCSLMFSEFMLWCYCFIEGRLDLSSLGFDFMFHWTLFLLWNLLLNSCYSVLYLILCKVVFMSKLSAPERRLQCQIVYVMCSSSLRLCIVIMIRSLEISFI